jgi:predicted ester cyclase
MESESEHLQVSTDVISNGATSIDSTSLASSWLTTSTARRRDLADTSLACAMVEAFPDYQWDLQRLLVDGQWLAARLYGTGTHTGPFRGIEATGRVIRTQELVIYRTVDGKILDCWGDLGSTVRDELTSGTTGA